MRSHIDEMIYDLAEALNKAAEFDHIMALPNCNGCRKQKECEHVPKWGERVRINCPLWEGKEGA